MDPDRDCSLRRSLIWVQSVCLDGQTFFRTKIFLSRGWERSAAKSFEPVHEISNNVVCATSKALDQPAYMLSQIRAFACRLNIL